MSAFDPLFAAFIAQAASPVIGLLAFFILLSLVLNFLLFRKLGRLTKGGDGRSLEGTIGKLNERVAELEKHATKAEAAFENVDARLQTAVRAVSVKRFDPFQNAGGQQSFASALVDEKGDGVVFSGIHSRDGVHVYSKSVAAFKSERELSAEEKSAIEDAKKKL